MLNVYACTNQVYPSHGSYGTLTSYSFKALLLGALWLSFHLEIIIALPLRLKTKVLGSAKYDVYMWS